MSYNLYLDDVRNPEQSYTGAPLNKPGNRIYLDDTWIIVRSYNDFVKCLHFNGIPNMISFDHDLADEHYSHYHKMMQDQEPHQKIFLGPAPKEKTGYDAMLLLLEHIESHNAPMPVWYVHSYNPIAAKIMRDTLLEYTEHKRNGTSMEYVMNLRTMRNSNNG